MNMNRQEIENLAKKIKSSDEWMLGDILKLCAAAGMLRDFEKANEENFESVIFAAADKLDVEII